MLLAFVLVVQYVVNYYFLKFEPSLSFIYSHPVYRVTDFVLGMLTAKMFLKYHRINFSTDLINLLQAISAVVFTAMLIASFNFRETTNYFSILFIIVIFIQAFDRGWLSEILKNRIIQKLSNISFEFYMCHELILFVLEKNISPYLTFNDELMKYKIIFTIGLPISILAAKLLNVIVTKKIARLIVK